MLKKKETPLVKVLLFENRNINVIFKVHLDGKKESSFREVKWEAMCLLPPIIYLGIKG